MVREDLITSAVLSFLFAVLQDPSVIGSPVDKRIAFLQSKNLTQEEIDVALARAGDSPSQPAAAPPAPQSYDYANQKVVRQPNGYGYGYGYGPHPRNPWSQPVE
ncbi:MAG: hypothetical protein Q9224_002580 [Gallowayella concinna]